MLDLMTGMARTVFVYGNPGSEGNPPVQGKPPAQIATENRGGNAEISLLLSAPEELFMVFAIMMQ